MAGLWKFILAILAAAIGGLLVIVFQDPIERAFNQDRLVMTAYTGSWAPYASSATNLERGWERQGLSPIFFRRIFEGDQLYLARIVVENPGSRTVDRIRITPGEYGPFQWLVLDKEGPRTLEEPQEVMLSAIEPGERVVLYAWSYQDLTSPYHFRHWHTFSSEGPAVFRLRAPTAQEDLLDTIGDWSGYVVAACFAVVFFLLLMLAAYYDAYFKQLLRDEDHYLEERLRFEQNPKRFEPKMKT